MSNFQFVPFIGGHLDGTIQHADIEMPHFHAHNEMIFNSQEEDLDNLSDFKAIQYSVYDRHLIRAQEKFFYLYVISTMSLPEAVTQMINYYGEKNK